MKLKEMPGVLGRRQGLPRVDWARLNKILAKKYHDHPHELARAYRAAEQDFVQELAMALNERRRGGPYRLVAGRNFDLLSSARPQTLQDLLVFAEAARSRILRALPNVADDSGYGAHVVLLFAADEDYDRYSRGYGTGIYAGAQGRTVGFYTNEGFGHFALRHGQASTTRGILAHELVHACLQHIRAPDWLHEGLACMLERWIGTAPLPTSGSGPHPRSIPGRAARRRLVDYWSRPGSRGQNARRDFWNGRGFYGGGSAAREELRFNCFAIAEGLVAWLYREKRKDFLQAIHEMPPGSGAPRALRALCDAADPVGFFLQAGE